MTEITLKSESRLEKILASGQFALTGELGPPKSVDVDFIRQKAEYLKGKVDAVNITDNQTAIVRMSSFAVALILKEMHLEPTMQITCRDRNRLAIQSDVLGAAAHGIHNILCLTGDHQCFGNHTTAKNVFDIDAVQLIEMLRQMRDEKKFANGEEIKNSKKAPIKEPRIFIGAAVNPFADPLKFRATRLAKKINAGVDFVQTQCIYDMERFNEWMKQVRNRGLHEKVKILAGVTPLKSVAQIGRHGPIYARLRRRPHGPRYLPRTPLQSPRHRRRSDKHLRRTDPSAPRNRRHRRHPPYGHRMGKKGPRNRRKSQPLTQTPSLISSSNDYMT